MAAVTDDHGKNLLTSPKVNIGVPYERLIAEKLAKARRDVELTFAVLQAASEPGPPI
jgi:hypothetical protein